MSSDIKGVRQVGYPCITRAGKGCAWRRKGARISGVNSDPADPAMRGGGPRA